MSLSATSEESTTRIPQVQIYALTSNRHLFYEIQPDKDMQTKPFCVGVI